MALIEIENDYYNFKSTATVNFEFGFSALMRTGRSSPMFCQASSVLL